MGGIDEGLEFGIGAEMRIDAGEIGHPVRAYLDVSEIIRVALECGADAIYPGYGFLSENPDLARAAAEAGIAFVGPGPEVLELAGDKVNAGSIAKQVLIGECQVFWNSISIPYSSLIKVST